MNVTLHHDPSPRFIELLSSALPDWVNLAVVPESDTEQLARILPTTEVLLHVLEPLTAAHFAAAPRLALVQKIGVGVNTIDLDAAKMHRVWVANMPGTNTQAVAEFTLNLMLCVLRRSVHLDAACRQGAWIPPSRHVDGAGELGGRTVGLVGFGAIAQRVAQIVEAFGATVLFTTPTPREDSRWRTLEELLSASEILSLHCPYTPESHHLIGRGQLGLLPQGAIVINTARGPLVDELALIDALESGTLRGAGLDVFETEPLRSGHPLMSMEQVVLASHLAWRTDETLRRSFEVIAQNVQRIRDGLAPLNHINL